jgi:hypothetical protein
MPTNGSNSNNNSGTFYLSEISRSLVVRGIPFKVKDMLLPLFQPSKMHNANLASLDFGDIFFFIWACYINPFVERNEKLICLSQVQNRRRFYHKSRLLCQLLCHIVQQMEGASNLSAYRDILWNHRLVSMGES